MKTSLMTMIAIAAMVTLSCEKEEIQQPTTYPLSSAVVGESLDTNNYSLGVSQMQNITDSKSYVVHYNLPEMDVSVGGLLSGGTLTVKIKQSDNTIIYDNSFQNILGHNQAITITPDDYTIEVDFDNVSGELGLAIDADQ